MASDEYLIEEFNKNHKNIYFDLLYERYKNKVYGKCLSMLNDVEISQDAMQEIFIKVLLSIGNFKNDSRFSTWLYSITYNYCIDVIRRGGKLAFENLTDNKEANAIYDENEDEYQKLFEIKVERLENILEKIPTSDKSILLMKYQGDLSIKQISEIFGKSESAIKMKIKRAKEKSLIKYEEIYND